MNEIAGFPKVDEILEPHRRALGADYAGYRNHVTRVLHFLFALEPALRDAGERLLVAAAFHDLGIWTSGTFDYLEPSCRLAGEYLEAHGGGSCRPEVQLVIAQHHKLRAYRGPFASTVEPFRRADLVDVSLGLVRFGLPSPFVRAVRAAFPNAGFHARLVALTGRQLVRSPLRPLPMFRW